MTRNLAVLGIAQVASMSLTAQIVDTDGSLGALRADVEASGYWPEFCRLVAAGDVTESFLPAPLGLVVVGWALAACRAGSEDGAT